MTSEHFNELELQRQLEELMDKQFAIAGKIFGLKHGREAHKCNECGLLIEPKIEYYQVVWAGSGLCGKKYPDRIHIDCLHSYTDKHTKRQQELAFKRTSTPTSVAIQVASHQGNWSSPVVDK